jgi:hypothetical protein
VKTDRPPVKLCPLCDIGVPTTYLEPLVPVVELVPDPRNGLTGGRVVYVQRRFLEKIQVQVQKTRVKQQENQDHANH